MRFGKWRTLALQWVKLLRWDASGGMRFPYKPLNVGFFLSGSSCAVAAQGSVASPGDLSLYLVSVVNLGHLHMQSTCLWETQILLGMQLEALWDPQST